MCRVASEELHAIEDRIVKMKYMKIGTKPDTFYTEEATRSVLSDVPTDLIIQVNNTRYQLHKFPLLLKCGLLQRLCSDTDSPTSTTAPVVLHDIPGGEEAFELCAKFCYGITISLSAHNFVPVFSAAKFLRMTESVSQGNLVMKLESFFDSCILKGWKDCIAILQSVGKQSSWSESPRIVRPCINSVVEKILTPPAKVTWSFTYTRPGYSQKQHKSAPKDWWTEDISDLELDIFRTIISAIRTTKQLPPPLIGEALHVYACKQLPDPAEIRGDAESSATEESQTRKRRVLESIVSMIPAEPGSVSGPFLLRLLKVANLVGASPSTKAELIRRSGRQLDEATVSDLIFPSPSNPNSYDIGMVEAITEHFLAQFRLPLPPEQSEHMVRSMTRVAKVFDSYLQVVARDPDLPVSKFINLAESLPDIARQEHDGFYQAIDTYLKEHKELSKADRKTLCQLIDCRKLSPSTRSHAITNDRLPLRTIVHLLFIEQERAAGASTSRNTPRNTPLDRSSIEISEMETRRPRQGSAEHFKHHQRQEAMARSLSLSEMKFSKEKNVAQGKDERSRIKSKGK